MNASLVERKLRHYSFRFVAFPLLSIFIENSPLKQQKKKTVWPNLIIIQFNLRCKKFAGNSVYANYRAAWYIEWYVNGKRSP